MDSDATPAIFISYRRDDSSDVTGRIYDRLIQHFGEHAVFKDVDSIPLGVDFRKHLGDSVGRCDVLLTVIGRQWLIGNMGQRRLDDVRDFVRIELEAALQRDIPVVPVLVRAASMPSLEDLPETLQSFVYRNGIPVRPDPDFHHDMDRLINGIEGHLKRKRESVVISLGRSNKRLRQTRNCVALKLPADISLLKRTVGRDTQFIRLKT